MMPALRPRILAFDTATSCCSVALTEGDQHIGKVVADLALCGTTNHSRRLLAAIDWLLAETAIDWTMIDGIAVSIGPGSFTGLRIGMATAKGFAFAAGKPLLGVSTLAALAAGCNSEKMICATLDARKKEVYAAFFRRDDSGRIGQIGKISVTSPEQLAEHISEPVYMVGDALVSYGGLWQSILGDNLEIAPAQLHVPAASTLGFLAAEQLATGKILDAYTVAPLYVRASDAELSLVKNSSILTGQSGVR